MPIRLAAHTSTNSYNTPSSTQANHIKAAAQVKPNACLVRSSTRRRAASRLANASASAGSTGFLLLLPDLPAASSRLRCSTKWHRADQHRAVQHRAVQQTQACLARGTQHVQLGHVTT